jgi:hypothetical protein
MRRSSDPRSAAREASGATATSCRRWGLFAFGGTLAATAASFPAPTTSAEDRHAALACCEMLPPGTFVDLLHELCRAKQRQLNGTVGLEAEASFGEFKAQPYINAHLRAKRPESHR